MNENDVLSWTLILAPLVLFVVISIIVKASLPDNFLENALKERKADGSISDKDSMSRLVLFISGLVSIAFSACISSYFIYHSIVNDTLLDLDPLVNALLALGIGVIPYSMNQIRGIIRG